MHQNTISKGSKGSKGFTLIELLLSIALTATVGLISYSALDVLSSASIRIEAQNERMQEINLAMTVMGRDFRQIQPRPVRDDNGQSETAFWGNGSGDDMVVFTRSGWQNPTNTNRSKLQRVHYHARGNTLIRESWTVLDRNFDAVSFNSELLEGVSNISVRFLAPLLPDNSGELQTEWRDSWVPESLLGDNAFTPIALEISFDLEDWGNIKRLYQTATYWPDLADFKRWGKAATFGREAPGSGRTQSGSGRSANIQSR